MTKEQFLIKALEDIIKLDPEEDTKYGFNEWGEAKCFSLAQDIAIKALKDINEKLGKSIAGRSII